jgi:hypothetical protein
MKKLPLILGIPLITACSMLQPTNQSIEMDNKASTQEVQRYQVSAKNHQQAFASITSETSVKKRDRHKYLELLAQGVPREALTDMSSQDIRDIYTYANHVGNVPVEIFKNYDTPSYLIGREWAQAQPEYTQSIEDLQQHIIHELEKNTHLERNYGKKNRKQNYEQISDVQSKEILVLIEKYRQFFSSETSFPLISELMQSDREEGGLLIPKGNSLQLVQIISSYQDKHSYDIRMFENYARHTGSVHTHLLEDEVPEAIAGPSLADIHILNQDSQQLNPYKIDVTISQIANDNSYNIDLTFSDVIYDSTTNSLETRYYNKEPIIIDVGIVRENTLEQTTSTLTK